MPSLAWRYEGGHAKSSGVADVCPRATKLSLCFRLGSDLWSYSGRKQSCSAAHGMWSCKVHYGLLSSVRMTNTQTQLCFWLLVHGMEMEERRIGLSIKAADYDEDALAKEVAAYDEVGEDLTTSLGDLLDEATGSETED